MRNLLTAILLLLPAFAAAAPDKSELAEAADFYRSGNYSAALENYQAFLKEDPGNPYLNYNAADCLWRQGRAGEAIAYYAKAFLAAPRDADIRKNLDFAMTQTGQRLVPEGVPAILHRAYYLLSDNELKALCLLVFWLLCLARSAIAFREALRPKLETPIYALAAALILTWGWAVVRSGGAFRSAGAVITDNARLLSGPGANFKTSASIKAGTLVKVLDDSDETYLEIGIPREGVKGWLERASVERI